MLNAVSRERCRLVEQRALYLSQRRRRSDKASRKEIDDILARLDQRIARLGDMFETEGFIAWDNDNVYRFGCRQGACGKLSEAGRVYLSVM